MNRCPLTYQLCESGRYSIEGLRTLSRSLKVLHDLEYTSQEQLKLAAQLAHKLSIQGIQPKLSAKLNIAKGLFVVVEKGGTFILKPPHPHYEELPQNEDVTMRMAAAAGIEVPLHGMIFNKDATLTYFIKRFDRLPKGHKLGVEDFAQLLGFSRETKYDSSMEQVASVIEKFCTFPVVEKLKLFRLVLFSFLVGNEDMHLKNFTLIRRAEKVSLSPAYDLLNTTLALGNAKEELALPLAGKKNRLKRSDLVDYFGENRLRLAPKILKQEVVRFEQAIPQWEKLLQDCFLSTASKESYLKLIHSRWDRFIK